MKNYYKNHLFPLYLLRYNLYFNKIMILLGYCFLVFKAFKPDLSIPCNFTIHFLNYL